MAEAKHRVRRQWPRVPAHDREAAGPRGGSGPGWRSRRLWSRELLALGLVVVIGAGAATLLLTRGSRRGVLPHVQLSGVDVGGLDQAALRTAAARIAVREGRERVTVARPASDGFPRAATSATLEGMGFRVDLDATIRNVLGRGRQANPIAALADQLRATFGSLDIRPVLELDRTRFDSWLGGAERALSVPPREGGISFRGVNPRGVDPAPGLAVDRQDMEERVVEAVAGGSLGPVLVTSAGAPARTDLQDVAQVVAQARRAVSGTVVLERGIHDLLFDPQQIAGLLTARPVAAPGGNTTLRLAADPVRLRKLVGDVAGLETPPASARFVTARNSVRLIPSRDGFRFDAGVAAEELVRVATSANRFAPLQGRRVPPRLTTVQARALHVTERVSTFTTYYSCCQPRVVNIHRAADVVRGAVVEPGQEFSLNQVTGERTAAKGYVVAPAISGGKIIQQMGGGISQFTTTLYNAIFFGGYRILEHQAHSFYFTRYPPGREATLSWRHPDLRFLNDSKAGVYIATSYTDTSITVSFYGSQPNDVESETGAPSRFTHPKTTCTANPSLGPGVTNLTQEGSDGFDIVVQRILTSPDGNRRVETYATHYLPEPRLVERLTCEKSPSPRPSPSPGGSAGPTPSPKPTPTPTRG